MIAPRRLITPSMNSGIRGSGVISSGRTTSVMDRMSRPYSSAPTWNVTSCTVSSAAMVFFSFVSLSFSTCLFANYDRTKESNATQNEKNLTKAQCSQRRLKIYPGLTRLKDIGLPLRETLLWPALSCYVLNFSISLFSVSVCPTITSMAMLQPRARSALDPGDLLDPVDCLHDQIAPGLHLTRRPVDHADLRAHVLDAKR